MGVRGLSIDSVKRLVCAVQEFHIYPAGLGPISEGLRTTAKRGERRVTQDMEDLNVTADLLPCAPRRLHEFGDGNSLRKSLSVPNLSGMECAGSMEVYVSSFFFIVLLGVVENQAPSLEAKGLESRLYGDAHVC